MSDLHNPNGGNEQRYASSQAPAPGYLFIGEDVHSVASGSKILRFPGKWDEPCDQTRSLGYGRSRGEVGPLLTYGGHRRG